MGSVLTYNGSVLRSSTLVFENDYIPMSDKGTASGVATLDTNSKVTASQTSARMVNVDNGGGTLSNVSNGCLLVCYNTDAILTLPDANLESGFECEIMNYGSYTVTINCANSNVYINGVSGASVTIPERYTSAVLKLINSGNRRWVIQGAIE